MALSQDGSVVALSAGKKVVVLERGNAAWTQWRVRLNLTSPDAVYNSAILSDDASIVALAANDNQGVIIYTYSPATGIYVRACAIPPLGGLTVGKLAFSGGSAPLLVVTHNDIVNNNKWAVVAFAASAWAAPCSAPLPLWTYRSAASSKEYADFISSIAVTPDGDYVAIGSWGDKENVNPQLHVFRGHGGDGKPVLSHVSAGSVTYVGLFAQASALTVLAVGMQHHENVGVMAGTVFAVSVPV
jgi:hypothetical protein